MIVSELMTNGDLRNYLNKHKPTPGELVPSGWQQTLLEFCKHIAAGMDYLSKKKFVHRDLAARNVLVAANKTCKISDFGMSRELEQDHYISKGGMVPVKWTAPEAVMYKKYSTSSDVWSFGAVMYEIWSLGQKPFQKYTNVKALELVKEGYRLPPPPGCPKEIYRVMIQCWHPDPSLRPSFDTLLESLLEPESRILHWSQSDLSEENNMATVLGAQLEAGERLYLELQSTYMHTYETA